MTRRDDTDPTNEHRAASAVNFLNGSTGIVNAGDLRAKLEETT